MGLSEKELMDRASLDPAFRLRDLPLAIIVAQLASLALDYDKMRTGPTICSAAIDELDSVLLVGIARALHVSPHVRSQSNTLFSCVARLNGSRPILYPFRRS